MVSQQALLKILANGKYHSGTALGEQFGVSRAAIGKAIQKIEQAFRLTVFAVKGKGYRLQQPLDLLNKDRITSNLSKTTLKQINEFEIFFDIDSTNHYLSGKSLDGAPGAYLVLAEQQTNGQGRRGRKWVSPFGSNLYLSLLWRFQQGAAQLGCLSLYVAVAVVRALRELGINDAGVKWPNDIYWNNKKLAGILLEMRGELSGPSAVVVGIGLNIATLEDKFEIDNIDQPWIDLERITGKTVDRNHFTSLVIDALFEVLSAVPDEHNILLEEWQNMDVLNGENIEVHFSDKVITGKALGINQNGALKVRSKGKDIICHSGEVSIRRG